MTVKPKRRKTTNARAARGKATNSRRKSPNRSVKVYAARRNPSYRRKTAPNRKRRKARNPQLKTLIIGSLYAAGGAMAQGLVASFIPLKAEGLAGIGINLGIAYATAMLGERILGAGINSQFFAVGAAAGVGRSILDYALGIAKGAVGQLAPAGAPTIGTQTPDALTPGQMADIAAWNNSYGLPENMGDIAVWQ